MTQIRRVVTHDRVYFIGQPLPVPDGCPVEPFLIEDIIWDEELDKIQFICAPDEELARKQPEKTEQITDDEYALLLHHHEQARFALENQILISATISADNARIESVIQRKDYEQFLREQYQQDNESVDDSSNDSEASDIASEKSSESNEPSASTET